MLLKSLRMDSGPTYDHVDAIGIRNHCVSIKKELSHQMRALEQHLMMIMMIMMLLMTMMLMMIVLTMLIMMTLMVMANMMIMMAVMIRMLMTIRSS